jgi:malate synthase A
MAIPSAARIEGAERVLTAPALAFVEDLTRRFRPRIDELLARRRVVQDRYNKGDRPSFIEDTASVRGADWKVGSIPADLQDRRVEITGPCDRKMIINALNSGASVFMADFEDATSPTWSNIVSGQVNPRRRRPPHDLLREPRHGQALRAQPTHCDVDGPASRVSPARAPLRGRRPSGAGYAVRLRHVLVPQH